MTTTLPPQVVVGLIVLVGTVLSHLRPRPLTPPRLLITPVAVVAAGVLSLIPQLVEVPDLDRVDALFVAVDVALSIALGYARGRTVRIEALGSVPHYRYGGVTVALWAASLVARAAAGRIGLALGAAPVMTGGTVLAMLGLSLLVQNGVVLRRRASRATPTA